MDTRVLKPLLLLVILAQASACKMGQMAVSNDPFPAPASTSSTPTPTPTPTPAPSGSVSPIIFGGVNLITNVTHNSVRLGWTNTAGAAFYSSYDTTSGTQIFIANTTAPASQQDVMGLQPSTAYMFRVKLTDTNGLVDGNTVDASVTTLANVPPLLAAIGAQTAYQAVAFTVDAMDQNTSSDIDADGDAISYTCYYDTVVDGSVANTQACTTLANEGGGNATFAATTGILNWTPLNSIVAGTQYEFKITGSDPYGGTSSRIFVTTVQTGVPSIAHTPSGNQTFPSMYLDQGNTLNIDFYNQTTGSDAGISSYACYFDTLVDGTVASTNACTTLPGTATFNTSTGVLSWTPDSTAYGPFEIRVHGVNGAGSSDDLMTIDVRQPFVLTNLIAYLDAQFANGSIQGINSPFTSTWKDASSAATTYDGILNNFGATTSSGWAGTGIPASPYRIVLDGTNDFVNFGSGVNANTSVTIEASVRPAAPTTAGKVILSNADATGLGLALKQSNTASGKLELTIGRESYVDEVLKDTPTAYWRLGETSGTNAVDASGNGNNGTYQGTVSYAQTGAFAGSNNVSAGFNGSNTFMTMPSAMIQSRTILSLEAWFQTTGGGVIYGYSDAAPPSNPSQYVPAIYVGTDGKLRGELWMGSVSPITSAAVVNDGLWHHVVLVANSNTQSLYLDGALVNTLAGSITPLTMTFNQIGVNYTNSWPAASGLDYFQGNIDEAAFYSSALTLTRISAHYAARTRTSCETATTFAANAWHVVFAAFDSASTNLKMFVDGVQECSVTNAGAVFSGSGDPLSAGATVTSPNTPTASSYWQGSIGDVRVYNSALTSGNASTNFNAVRGRFGL